jgi:hypothetical protein
LGVTAKCHIRKGTFFCYEGFLQKDSEAGEYTLAVGAVASPPARVGQVVYINGAVTDDALLGGMNEFIWDPAGNQFEFGEAGLVRALRDVAKGETCYIGYGEDYDWDGIKVSLAQELASTLLACVETYGHPSFAEPVTRILDSVLGWTKASLPLKRIGSGLERLFMAVVDNRVPREMCHSVWPGYLVVEGRLEGVGRWLERVLCSVTIIERSAFRRANDPRRVSGPLATCMVALTAGSRTSPRGLAHKNYCMDDEFDFPPLVPARRLEYQEAQAPTRVVSLTLLNDPLLGRPDAREFEGLSLSQLECMVSDQSEVEWLNNPTESVGEWTLSVAIQKCSAGRSTMSTVLEIVRDEAARPESLLNLMGGRISLQRRLSPRAASWHKMVEDDGWSGWLMLEWFDRVARSPGAERLNLKHPRDRAWMAVFLESLASRGTDLSLRDRVRKCVVRLREKSYRPLIASDNLGFDITHLSKLCLGLQISCWEVSDEVAHLVCNETGTCIPSAGNVEEATLGAYHMSRCGEHFYPFLLPSGIPSLTGLSASLLAAARAELLGSGEQDSVAPEVEVVEDSSREMYPIFRPCPPADKVRFLGGPGFDPHKAVIFHYNVDKLTDDKITLVGAQAASLHIDLFHLLDTRVTAAEWPSVKARLSRALAGSRMKWMFFFFEGASRRTGKASVGGQIIGYTNRLTCVKCEEVVKLGAAVCVSFNLSKSRYASIGTYWPCLNKEEGSFMSHLESAYSGLDAVTTLKHGIAMAVHAAGSNGRLVLVGGDFNSDLRVADQYGLRRWSAEAGLTEASTGVWSERPSFVRPAAVGVTETRIDHVFTTDMTAILSCSPIDPEFLVSHHRPLLTRVDIEYCARREVYHGLKRVNMMFCPTSRANRIGAVCSWLEESDLLDWDDPEAFLEFVGVHTVKACTLSKGIRKEKDGWSPITKGLTMNLRAIVTMLRHVHGYQSYKNLRWTEVNFKPGLHAILRRWRQHGRKIAHTGELQAPRVLGAVDQLSGGGV